MVFAPDGAEPSALTSSNPGLLAALLRLCELLGTGIVQLDELGRAWPLNDVGGRLLQLAGGGRGATLNQPALASLHAARITGQPQSLEAGAGQTRSLTLAALADGGTTLLALRDSTDEKLMQERLLQSEKMASVGQLVSGVAHELNNPLTGVMGFAQLLLARPLDDSMRAQVQTIYGEAERAAKIVQNLLSFARRRQPAKEMADVNALLQRVLALCSYDFTIRNISLDMTLDTRMPAVWVDPDQIQQVFFNLIKNAEQAMVEAHGGGKLTVVSHGIEGGVLISIADDGPGIPPDIQRRIFDPFFTTKQAGEGTGLGLTISYGIVDEHGGRIWTENLPSGGAVFYVQLPLGSPTDGGPAASAPSSDARPIEREGRRVLVVDDEVSIRLLLHDILRLDDHAVALASNGIEAADLVSRENFDVVITDVKMPGMDGASFYRHVQKLDPARARRIIFITGDTVSPDTRAFLQSVPNPVLSKPFRIGPLREAIEAVLNEPLS